MVISILAVRAYQTRALACWFFDCGAYEVHQPGCEGCRSEVCLKCACAQVTGCDERLSTLDFIGRGDWIRTSDPLRPRQGLAARC